MSRCVVPSDNPAAAIEVRRDTNVVEADQFHDVVDVIDEVLDRRARRRGEFRVNLRELFLIPRTFGFRQTRERAAATTATASGRQPELFPQRGKGGRALG